MTASVSEQRLLARILLESGDLAGFDAVTARLADRLHDDHPWVRELRSWRSTIGEDAPGHGAVSPPYAALFEDRSVAIVGPAPPELDQGAEIDAFDVVVRFNYTGRVNGAPELVGRRTDVAWYNNIDSRAMTGSEPDAPSALFDLEAAFVKAITHDQQRGRRDAGRLFLMEQVPFLVRKRPNQLPNALWTVLRARPSRVKVFNSNFFLSSTPYGDSYRQSRFGFEGFLHSLNFEDHDLVSQLAAVRLLSGLPQVEVDAGVAAVLALSSFEYLEALGHVHVDGRRS